MVHTALAGVCSIRIFFLPKAREHKRVSSSDVQVCKTRRDFEDHIYGIALKQPTFFFVCMFSSAYRFSSVLKRGCVLSLLQYKL